MAKRKIININEDKCNGCGLCIPACPEGALHVIDGKLRLVSDLLCDGLGACIKECPHDAITIEEREAEPYDEIKVMENFEKIGREVNMDSSHFCGCPGSRIMDFSDAQTVESSEEGQRQSQLKQWPVQLHLVSTQAPYFKGKDVILSADCVAYAVGDFHKDYLKGKSLAIACPKLDEGQEVYVEKITSLIDDAQINTLTIMIMQVPCCGGLLEIAKEGASAAKRKIPIKSIVAELQGDIIKEEWV